MPQRRGTRACPPTDTPVPLLTLHLQGRRARALSQPEGSLKREKIVQDWRKFRCSPRRKPGERWEDTSIASSLYSFVPLVWSGPPSRIAGKRPNKVRRVRPTHGLKLVRCWRKALTVSW